MSRTPARPSVLELDAAEWCGITWDIWAAAVMGLTDDESWRDDLAVEMAYGVVVC